MNNLLAFDGIELWHIAGWTMLHFLWLGAAVGVVAVVARLMLCRAAPAVRYAAAVGCFALLAAMPLGIAAWLVTQRPVVEQVVEIAVPNMPAQAQAPAQPPAVGKSVQTAGPDLEAPTYAVPLVPDPARQPGATGSASDPEQLGVGTGTGRASGTAIFVGEVLQRWVPYLPWLWIVGAPITFALLATGVVGADRLRRASRPVVDGPIAEACARLIESLRITRRVAVAVCERIAAPVLVGILRPVILLPPSALTGWSPDEIEMVLLHELAHVRRWDNLVNLAQRLVESLLFFHPVIWWLSSWVRREREACCDAVVVGRTNRPHAYAEMLVALAAQMPRSVLFHPAASSAMAAGPLRSRIRRILQLEDDPMLISGRSLVMAVGTLVLMATLLMLYLAASGNAKESATEAEEFATEVTESTEENGDNEHADDILFLRKLFLISSKNPLQTRTYQLSPQQREVMPNAFEGFKKDPFGPQVQFEDRWSSDGSRVTIVAPRDAQSFLAQGFKLKLAEEEGQDQKVVEHHRQIEMTTASGEQVLAESQDGRLRVQIRNRRSEKFPSLEQQKLADVAWKALGLELEPIGEEDLARVKQFGYDGGVKVTNAVTRVAGTGQLVQEGDLLVGLHVWPTTSLSAVGEVLRRDDLEELDPLKFYVVRHEITQVSPGPEGNMIEESLDKVVTGRITVDPFYRPSRSRRGADPQPAPTSSGRGMEPAPPGLDELLRQQAQAPYGGATQPYQAAKERLAESIRRLELAQPHLIMLQQELMAAEYEAAQRSKTDSAQLQKKMEQLREKIEEAARNVEKQTRAVQEQRATLELQSQQLRQEAEKRHTEISVPRRAADNLLRQVPSGPWPVADGRLEPPQVPGEPPSVLTAQNIPLAPLAAPAPAAQATQSGPQGLPAPVVAAEPQPLWRSSPSLPYAVRFEQGASRFLDGDNIKVLEVRGTARTFEPGNFYWIKGIYKLGSHDRAQLAAYTTATKAGEGVSPTWGIQTTTVDRGRGTFELFLPMSYQGWPHVSYYPDGGGDGFGGTYFGTGEWVLKKWSDVYGKTDDSAAAPALDEDLFGDLGVPSVPAASRGRRGTGTVSQDAQRGIVAFRSSKPELRYEGRTFDQWRDEWRNELSTEKRLEAVKALVAFGRAGYGPQAAETILDIAGQYDFDAASIGSEKELKQTIISVLSGGGGSMVPYWLPDFAQQLEKDPKKWKGLARKVLLNVRTDNDQAIEVLQSLAESGPADLRLLALRSLVESSRMRSGGPKLDDKTLAILTQALHSKDPQMVYAATSFLFDGGNYLAYLSELPPLLFNPDSNVQKHARAPLHRLSPSDAAQIEGALISVLDDPARQDDHLAAVRALGAMGDHAASAVPRLEQILDQSEDPQLRIAAGFAIDRIEQGKRGINRLQEYKNSTEDEKSRTQLDRLMVKEQELQD